MNFESSTILVYKLMFNEAMKDDSNVKIFTGGFTLSGRVVKHDSNAVVIHSQNERQLTMVKLEKIEALSITVPTDY